MKNKKTEQALLHSKLQEDLPKNFNKRFWDNFSNKTERESSRFIFPAIISSVAVCLLILTVQLNRPKTFSEEAYISYIEEMMELDEMSFEVAGLEEEDDLSFSERPPL